MIIILLALLSVMLFALDRAYSRLWFKGLAADISFSNGTVYAGDAVELTEVISNEKRMLLPELEVGFRIQKGVLFRDAENIVISDFIYKKDVFSLRGMEAVKRKYLLECRQRGKYQVSKITMEARSFFHDRSYQMEMPGTDDLLVYAGNTDVSAIEAQCMALLGTAASRRSLYEDPFAFASIREYTPTDPMKRINWKAAAKTGKLMVNTYASVRSEQFVVFLDISDSRIVKESNLVELGISAAASLCRKMIRGGQEIALAVNTDPPVFFEPGRGPEKLSRIERFLTTDFTREKTVPFRTLLCMFSQQARDRICILISKDEKETCMPETGTAGEKRNSFPAVLVTPVLQDGEEKLTVKSSRRG